MNLQIFQTLQSDPRTNPLANNGQARITTLDDDNARSELAVELATFVCDGQYGRAMEVILQSYLAQQGQGRQNAAWVSGFFGSGKSHLQKMLGHLWANTEVSPGKRARDLVLELPEGVRAQFRELETLAARSGKPLKAACGAMPSGTRDAVRATVLAILFKSVGLPEKVPQARFCLWLQKHGHLAAVRAAVEADGTTWLEELDDLYVSPVIAAAVLKEDPRLAVGVTEAIDLIGRQFPDRDGDISTADEDGIVCLASVRGEASAVERLRKLLASALGDEWSTAKERELLLAIALDKNTKKPEPDLEGWLRNSFFSEHCKLFHSRPFIWQIWDGHVNGFSALVNYHKLAAPDGQGRKTLDQLTFTYLGDWIDRQKDDQTAGINGADDRLAAALDLQGQLKKILDGEPPYDIFVRWKPLQQQAIGWEPDINDGVRLNIRPFLAAQLRKGGKTGADFLRVKPGTIKWAKDRGKEPLRSKEEFPWFWGWDENNPAQATDFGAPVPGAPPAGDSFDGNRWNDLHYSRAAKGVARARQGGGKS